MNNPGPTTVDDDYFTGSILLIFNIKDEKENICMYIFVIVLLVTSVPTWAWKCSFSPFFDRLTNQPTDQQTNGRT